MPGRALAKTCPVFECACALFVGGDGAVGQCGWVCVRCLWVGGCPLIVGGDGGDGRGWSV